MTAYDKIFCIFFWVAFMIVQASYQKEYFAANKPAGRWWHFWQAAFYGIALTVIVPFAIHFGLWVGVKLLVIGIVERLALYDPILNVLRFGWRKIWYNGKGTTGSLEDWVENKLPSKWIIPLKIGYVIIFITAAIFIK